MESAVLSTLVRRYPRRLTMQDLLAEVNAYSEVPERQAVVERAIEGLESADLVRPANGGWQPTPASLRVVELELGL